MKNIISPCLWFDQNAAQAAEFYCSVFKDSKITLETPILVRFESAGQSFTCLNGGPKFKINPSISFFYISESAEEIDDIWEALTAGGAVMMPLDKYEWSDRYGWVQDKFGVSWQLSLGQLSDVGQKITPCLMFVGDRYGRAEEALNHYTSIFKDSAVDGILHFGDGEAPDEPGAVKHAQFAVAGYKMMVMDSAHQHDFSFNEGVSLVVSCHTQEEIDYYWAKLIEDGEESMCGWLKDKFGVSWQVIPAAIGQLITDPNRSSQTMSALLQMKKIDIAQLMAA